MEFIKHILLTAVIFIPLERLFAMYPEQKILRRSWFNDLIYWLCNGHIIDFGLVLIINGAILISTRYFGESVHAAVSSQPYVLQFIEIMVLSDLGFYFMHRAFHTVPWLWKFHAVHHSIEELDWMAGARIHPIDQIITKGVSLLPIFLLGFSDVVLSAYMLFYTWQTVSLHSNTNIKIGPLRWILASPEFHRWHHSKDRAARDKNFAAQLPVIDVIFGTMYMPSGQKPSAYGIDEPMPQNYLLQLAHPFRTNANPVNQDDATNAPSPPVAEPTAPASLSSRSGI